MPFTPNDTQVMVRRDDVFGDGFALYVFSRTPEGAIYAANDLVFSGPKDEGIAAEPSMHLRYEKAQVLMDQLWDCGLRPTEGKGSAGALAATEANLQDMRQIAFQLLNDKLKGA